MGWTIIHIQHGVDKEGLKIRMINNRLVPCRFPDEYGLLTPWVHLSSANIPVTPNDFTTL